MLYLSQYFQAIVSVYNQDFQIISEMFCILKNSVLLIILASRLFISSSIPSAPLGHTGRAAQIKGHSQNSQLSMCPYLSEV